MVWEIQNLSVSDEKTQNVRSELNEKCLGYELKQYKSKSHVYM